MSFRPNVRGPLCPCGEIIVVAAGTAVSLASNWNPNYNPETAVDASHPEQYAIGFEDIIISSPYTNTGGIFLVSYDIAVGSGSKALVDTILMYIPKGSPPISLKQYLGSARFNPNALAFDADNAGDKVWAIGVL